MGAPLAPPEPDLDVCERGPSGLTGLVCNVMEQWLKELANPASRSSKGFTRLVKVVEGQVYTGPDQFILEFLQNAEDARMELCTSKGEACGGGDGVFRVKIYRDPRVIVIENNGKPIDRDDVDAICNAAQRKDPSKGYRGFIGIGWKSVFKVADRVDVASVSIDNSDYVSFTFYRDFWTKDAGQELLKKYSVPARDPDEDLPWEVIPLPLPRPQDLEPGWTRFTVYVRDDSTFNEVISIINEKLRGHLFLFLRYINKVEVEECGDPACSDKRVRMIYWQREGDEETCCDGKVHVRKYRVLEDDKPMGRFLVFSRAVEVPPDVKNDKATRDARRQNVKEREISIAFQLDPDKDEIVPLKASQIYGVYSFLPLEEVRSGLRFLMQADFIVQAGRRTMNFYAEWNRWLIREIAGLLKEVVQGYLQHRYTGSYVTALSYSTEIDKEMRDLLQGTVWKVLRELYPSMLVLDYWGNKRQVTEVFRPSEPADFVIYELVDEGLLSEGDIKNLSKEVFNVELSLIHKDYLPEAGREVRLPKEASSNVRELRLDNENVVRGLINALGKEKAYRALVRAYEKWSERWKDRLRNALLPDAGGAVARAFALAHVNELSFDGLPEPLRERKDVLLKYRDVAGKRFVDDDFVRVVSDQPGGYQKALELLKSLGVEILEAKDLSGGYSRLLTNASQQPKLSPDELAVFTMFTVFYDTLRGPFWALSTSGKVDLSDRLYTPDVLEFFSKSGGSLDDLKDLGIEVLDLDRYKSLSADEQLVKKLLATGRFRGLCDDDLIKGIARRASEKVGGNPPPQEAIKDHARLVAYLKELFKKCGSRVISFAKDSRLRVVSLSGRVFDVSELGPGKASCLLSSKYGPEWVEQVKCLVDKLGSEDALKRVEERLEDEKTCLITDEYLKVDNDVEGWSKFWGEILVGSDVNAQQRNRLLGDLGEEYVKRWLEGKGKEGIPIGGGELVKVLEGPTKPQGEPCDLRFRGVRAAGGSSAEEFCVEVKTYAKPNERIDFTDNEFEALIGRRDRYILAVVTDFEKDKCNPSVYTILARTLLTYMFEKELDKLLKEFIQHPTASRMVTVQLNNITPELVIDAARGLMNSTRG